MGVGWVGEWGWEGEGDEDGAAGPGRQDSPDGARQHCFSKASRDTTDR